MKISLRNMSKTIIGIVITIFVTAFIAGIFSGVAMKTGVDANPDSLMVNILSEFCKAFSGVPGGEVAHSTCVSSYLLLTLVLVIAGVVEIITTSSMLGNWVVGFAIYAFGWFVGVLLILTG